MGRRRGDDKAHEGGEHEEEVPRVVHWGRGAGWRGGGHAAT